MLRLTKYRQFLLCKYLPYISLLFILTASFFPDVSKLMVYFGVFALLVSVVLGWYLSRFCCPRCGKLFFYKALSRPSENCVHCTFSLKDISP